MSVSLAKGGRVSLSKDTPSLNHIKVGLAWDANATDTGSAYDLDASVFLLGSDGKVVSDAHFIFYNNKTSPCGSVVHQGDSTTGQGDGDDEVVLIELNKVAPEIEKIVFTVTINDADTKNQNFGQVSNSLIRITNQENNTELAKFELDEDYSSETAINFGELYRKDGGWNFKATGDGFKDGLVGFCKMYGVSI